MSTKFNVGDKVKVKSKSVGKDFDNWFKESEGKVLQVITSINGMEIIIDGDWFLPSDLELVEEGCCTYCGSTSGIPNYQAGGIYMGSGGGFEIYQSKNKTIMSKITTFAKNLVLSADEKLLRKHGLHDECGNHTDEAEQLVIAKLVKENEAYLIELAKGLEAEEVKNK